MGTRCRFTFVALVVVMVGCGGGGGGSGGGAPDPLDPANANATISSGDYDVVEVTATASGVCANEVGLVDQYQLTVTVVGDTVTVVDSQGRSHTGTLSGNRLLSTDGNGWSYPDDGGITTITSIRINVVSGTRLSGSSSWTWSDGEDSCKGTTYFTAILFAP